jgi:hypothetical protein
MNASKKWMDLEHDLKLMHKIATSPIDETRDLVPVGQTAREARFTDVWNRAACRELQSRQLKCIRRELYESIKFAEEGSAAEKLAGNAVKEEFWKGELAALHRIEHAIQYAS